LLIIPLGILANCKDTQKDSSSESQVNRSRRHNPSEIQHDSLSDQDLEGMTTSEIALFLSDKSGKNLPTEKRIEIILSHFDTTEHKCNFIRKEFYRLHKEGNDLVSVLEIQEMLPPGIIQDWANDGIIRSFAKSDPEELQAWISGFDSERINKLQNLLVTQFFNGIGNDQSGKLEEIVTRGMESNTESVFNIFAKEAITKLGHSKGFTDALLAKVQDSGNPTLIDNGYRSWVRSLSPERIHEEVDLQIISDKSILVHTAHNALDIIKNDSLDKRLHWIKSANLPEAHRSSLARKAYDQELHNNNYENIGQILGSISDKELSKSVANTAKRILSNPVFDEKIPGRAKKLAELNEYLQNSNQQK